MADISLKHPHGLSLDDAKIKVEQIVQDVQSEFPALVDKINWNGDKTQASVKGKGFDGDFRVDDTNVGIDINLKLFAKPFKGKVQEKIQSRVAQYFG